MSRRRFEPKILKVCSGQMHVNDGYLSGDILNYQISKILSSVVTQFSGVSSICFIQASMTVFAL